MILTRDKGQRMWGGNGGTSIGIGGSGGGGGNNGVSIPYYNQNFELLYKKVVTDGTTGTVTTQYLTAAPNEIVNVGTETDPATGDVTVTTIVGPKVKSALVIGDAMLVWDAQNSAVYVINRDGTTAANLYATGGVSSLGYSPGGGGGGGGASALSQLVDVQLSSLSNGQMLIYDSSQSKWINANIPVSGGTVTSVGVTPASGSHLNVTGSPVTSSGTINIGLESGYSIPSNAKQSNWDSAYTWVQTSRTTLADYGITNAYTKTEIVSILADYATKTWVGQQGYLTSSALRSYLPLSGGTMTGLIVRTSSGWWVKGRDNAVIKQTDGGVSGHGWATVFSAKTLLGSWELGTISEQGEKLILAYTTDSDYNNNVNTASILYFPTGSGTLARISDNVASATKLQTARNLWGNSFDGTADIGTQNSNASLNYVADINMSGNLTCQNVFARENVRIYEGNNWWWAFGYQAGSNNSSFNLVRYNNSTYATTIIASVNTSGSISIVDSLCLNNKKSIYIKKANGDNVGVLTIDGDNNFVIGETADLNGCNLYMHGKEFIWQYAASASVYRTNLMTLNNSGQLWVKQAAQGVRIGDGVIRWDSTNNAFQVIKSDGTAANLYTTGGVSALGMSAGVSSIDSMTFGYLKVNSLLTLPSTIVSGTSQMTIVVGMSPMITQYANDFDCIYLFNDSATSKINSETYRFTQYDNVGIHGTDYEYGETWWIDPDGCALFKRLYLSNSVYIFTDGSNIKCRINSNVYTLTKS